MNDLLNLVNALTQAVSAQLLEKDQAQRLLNYYIEKEIKYNIKEDKAAEDVKPVEIIS